MQKRISGLNFMRIKSAKASRGYYIDQQAIGWSLGLILPHAGSIEGATMSRMPQDLSQAGYIDVNTPNPLDFKRFDQMDDAVFYTKDRFVDHLDLTALQGVQQLLATLIPQTGSHILDLMASWDSHLPPSIKPEIMVGLGLNPRELARNKSLHKWIVHDLNKDPELPFTPQSFDYVLNTVSVDYLVNPIAVFKNVGRVLRPGGLFLIIFSNRYFEPKVTAIWRRSSETERVALVETWLEASGGFSKPSEFIISGLPRPPHDKYAGLGIPSDPIYAVYAKSE
jgi:SAM-dependent methyltransferase